MSRTKPRRHLRPRFERLESRSLLSSSAQYIGVSSLDVSGPTAAIGPGGYRNIELKLTLPLSLSGQATTLDYLNIAGPTGFEWAYGAQVSGSDLNPQAASNITIVQEPITSGATTEVIDVYISPVVLYVDPNSGSSSNPQLPNGSTLSLTDEYTPSGGTATTDTWQSDQALVIPISDRNLSQNLADTAPPLPALGFETFTGTAEPQTSDGKSHISINLATGESINPATAQLSDVAGLYWTTNGTQAHNQLNISISYPGNGSVADIAFPPERDESGTTMTFHFQLNDDPTNTIYVTDVAIPANYTNPTLRDPVPTTLDSTPVTVVPTSLATPNMVYYTVNGVESGPIDIQSLLNMQYENITLADGSTGGIYTIAEQLSIPHGMILQAADSNVEFNFTMSSVDQGVINLEASHITLKGFKIRFQNQTVTFTDSNNSPAIISDEEQASQFPRVDLNIDDLDIQVPNTQTGPGSPFGPDDNGTITTVSTIRMGLYDSGTIQNNTILGGEIQLYFGPWLVTGNRILGAAQGTVSPAAFSVFGGHDITLGDLASGGNTVSDANQAQNGYIDRFLTANQSGFNINLSYNVVANVGLPAPTPNGQSTGNPRNDPEVIVFEDYRKTFEGSVQAVGLSSPTSQGDDRQLVSIPTSELMGLSGGGDPGGLTLTILDGGTIAGTSIPVLQSFDSGGTQPAYEYFLLASPLPQGDFDIDISPAYVNTLIDNNSIDTSDTVSTALVLSSTMINTTVTYNTLKGDQSSEAAGYGVDYSQAIRFELHVAKNESYNVVEATIDHNTIINSIGGIQMMIDQTGNVPTTYGRTYGFLTLTNNTFDYSYQNTSIISINVNGSINYSYTVSNSSYSKLVNGSVVYDSSAAHFVDPRTLAITASGNTVDWQDVTPPATDVTLNAFEIRTASNLPYVLYEQDATVTPPLLPVANPLDFDFGNNSTSVTPGYTLVNPVAYSDSMGYGFTQEGNYFNATAGSVYALSETFQVNLPPGTYDVTPTIGDPSGQASPNTVLTLQGNEVETITTTGGQLNSATFLVTVGSNGTLTLEIQQGTSGSNSVVCLHALAIAPHTGPITFQFGQNGTTPAAGNDLVTAYTHYSSSLGNGVWSPLSSDLNADSTDVYASILTFRVDLPAGSYLVTPTLGFQGNAADSAEVQVQGVEVGVLDTGASSQKPSYVAVVNSAGYLSLEFDGFGHDTIVHLQSLSIIPLQFSFSEPGIPSTFGYTPVIPSTSYSSTQGYGFAPNPMSQNATSDAVYALAETFQVNLPPGRYDIALTIGDPTGQASLGTEVIIQGSEVDKISTGSDQTATTSYLVLVGASGLLTIEIEQDGDFPNDVVSLHGLMITSQPKPFDIQFGQFGTTPMAGYDLVTDLTPYSSSLGEGTSATSANASSVYGSVITYRLDLVNGIYKVNLVLAGTSDSVTVQVGSTSEAPVTTGTNAYSTSYTAIVSSGYLMITLSAPTGYSAGFESLSVIPLGVVSDYSGDGKSDFAVYDVASATYYILYSSGGSLSLQFGPAGSVDIPVPGDYDGDGKTDIAIYDQSNATYYILPSGGGPGIVKQFGAVGDRNYPVVGDYDGDGKTDYAIYDETTATFYILESGGGSIVKQLGNVHDINIPISGDFDGDGKTDIGIYDETAAEFFILESLGGTIAQPLGTPNAGDTPVVGDFNGDGKTDFAVYDPSTKEFIVDYNNGSGGVSGGITMSFPSTLPSSDVYEYLVGDYQGAGIDFVIFDQSTSTFYVYSPTGTLIRIQQLGPGGVVDDPL